MTRVCDSKILDFGGEILIIFDILLVFQKQVFVAACGAGPVELPRGR